MKISRSRSGKFGGNAIAAISVTLRASPPTRTPSSRAYHRLAGLISPPADAFVNRGHRKDPDEPDHDHHRGDDRRLRKQTAHGSSMSNAIARNSNPRTRMPHPSPTIRRSPTSPSRRSCLRRLLVAVPTQRQRQRHNRHHTAAVRRIRCDIGDEGRHNTNALPDGWQATCSAATAPRARPRVPPTPPQRSPEPTAYRPSPARTLPYRRRDRHLVQHQGRRVVRQALTLENGAQSTRQMQFWRSRSPPPDPGCHRRADRHRRDQGQPRHQRLQHPTDDERRHRHQRHGQQADARRLSRNSRHEVRRAAAKSNGGGSTAAVGSRRSRHPHPRQQCQRHAEYQHHRRSRHVIRWASGAARQWPRTAPATGSAQPSRPFTHFVYRESALPGADQCTA